MSGFCWRYSKGEIWHVLGRSYRSWRGINHYWSWQSLNCAALVLFIFLELSSSDSNSPNNHCDEYRRAVLCRSHILKR